VLPGGVRIWVAPGYRYYGTRYVRGRGYYYGGRYYRRRRWDGYRWLYIEPIYIPGNPTPPPLKQNEQPEEAPEQVEQAPPEAAAQPEVQQNNSTSQEGSNNSQQDGNAPQAAPQNEPEGQ
jgi:hypothetical protein